MFKLKKRLNSDIRRLLLMFIFRYQVPYCMEVLYSRLIACCRQPTTDIYITYKNCNGTYTVYYIGTRER
jgi:hypothetical protein